MNETLLNVLTSTLIILFLITLFIIALVQWYKLFRQEMKNYSEFESSKENFCSNQAYGYHFIDV